MTRRARISLLVLGGALLLVLWLVPTAALSGFTGVLIAVAVRGVSDPFAERSGMPGGLAAVLVVALVLAAFGAFAWLAAPTLVEQADALARTLPDAVAGLRGWLEGFAWGDDLLGAIEDDRLLDMGRRAAGMATSALAGTIGVLGTALFVVLLGAYFAAQPALYLFGLSALLDPALDGEAKRLLRAMGDGLRGWLLGQLVGMAFVGATSFAGLWALGVPLAGVLAVLSALLNFIPILGPFIAAVPAVLVAGASGDLTLALWVASLYLAVQIVEGDLLTPMVQSRAANIPPGVLLLGQLFLGGLFGLAGLALAAPLLAMALPLVRETYVGGYLRPRQSERDSAEAVAEEVVEGGDAAEDVAPPARRATATADRMG